LPEQKKINCFVISNIPTMQLMMYIGNDLIESVNINVQDLRVPGYLGKFKRTLKDKYRELVLSDPESVEFLVFNPDIKPDGLISNQAH
jgi:hypothetical protein